MRDPTSSESQRRLAAIMFTDMVGFSALTHRDESAALRLLEIHFRLLRPVITEQEGREIKTIGDSFMVAFPSALKAVRCGVAMQEALRHHNEKAPPEDRILIRIGIHLGDVEYRMNDAFGDGVNIAARIEPLAEPGGICLTRQVWDHVHNKLPHVFESLGTPRLKNITAPIEVFRLVLPGQVDDAGQVIADEPRVAEDRRRPAILRFAAVPVAVLALGWFAWVRFPADPTSGDAARPETSIAVLPFEDLSPEGDQEYFADGLAEEILNRLAGIRELKVTGRASSFSFRDRSAPIPEIGSTLGVAHLLDGSVRKAGERLRISAQLVETGGGVQQWSRSFDRQLEDIFQVQDEIASDIAGALEVTLTRRTASVPDHLEAYDLYLRAKGLIYRRGRENLLEARALIDRALALDPEYPAALAASGELWLLLSDNPTSYGDIPEDQANAAAREELERALVLDPEQADAHAAMGLLHMKLGELDQARTHLERAREINPSLANANHWLGLVLSTGGRVREAIENGSRFLETDPLFVATLASLGMGHLTAGQIEEGEEVAARLARLFPDRSFGFLVQAAAHWERGRLAAAADAIERAITLAGAETLTGLYAEHIYYALGSYSRALEVSIGGVEVQALIAAGRPDEGIARVRERLSRSPGNQAAHWSLLQGLSLAGEHEELLATLAGTWAERGWGDAASLEIAFGLDWGRGLALAPLAAAQRATGRTAEFAATLEHWGNTLSFLDEHGHASPRFVFAQANYHALRGDRDAALGKLTAAVDLGYRDPLLLRWPAFEPWRDDTEFQELNERVVRLIDDERARLDQSLPDPFDG